MKNNQECVKKIIKLNKLYKGFFNLIDYNFLILIIAFFRLMPILKAIVICKSICIIEIDKKISEESF